MKTLATFGPYRLVHALAANAETITLVSVPTGGSDHVLALRFMRQEHLGEDGESLEEGLRNAVRLNHVNIAQTLDAGRWEDLLYVAQEYVHGYTLAQVFEATGRTRAALPHDVACFIAAELCAGLTYAHSRRDQRGQELDIVHGDLRPREILLSPTGDVKISAFGFGRSLVIPGDTARLSALDRLDTLAPEVARGEAPTVASDVFASAAIAYRMFTGRTIHGDAEDRMAAAIAGDVTPVRQHDATVPEPVSQLIMRGLSMDPSARFRTAGEFRSGLAAWLRRNSPGFGRHRLRAYFDDLADLSVPDLGGEVTSMHRKDFAVEDGLSLIAEAPSGDAGSRTGARAYLRFPSAKGPSVSRSAPAKPPAASPPARPAAPPKPVAEPKDAAATAPEAAASPADAAEDAAKPAIAMPRAPSPLKAPTSARAERKERDGDVPEEDASEEPAPEADGEVGATDAHADAEAEVLAARPIDSDAGTEVPEADEPEPVSVPARPRSEDPLEGADEAGRQAAGMSADDIANAVYDDSVEVDRSLDSTPAEDPIDRSIKVPGRGGPLKLLIALVVLAVAGVAVAHFVLDYRITFIDDLLGETVTVPGSVWIESSPLNATILLNGQDTGQQTPATLADLAPGSTATVSVRLEGYREPEPVQLAVESNRRPTARFTLTPLPHTVRIDSEPAGATIMHEGNDHGVTPGTLGPLEVAPGVPVRILLRLEGYLDEYVETSWEPAQEQSTIRASLRPDPRWEPPEE